MLFHYALVDDLIGREEFERRVAEKIDECGDLVDEPTAAMMVVGELGRAHVKIRDLSARSSLFSFFGKVIDKTEPKVFDRQDGEKGAVATLLLGDETGLVPVVLWDERAGAAEEVVPGDVLEVIGKHPGKNAREIYALALRKAGCRIECSLQKGEVASLKNEPVDLDMVLLSVGEKRSYERRDGSTGEFLDALAGDGEGTARIVAWVPDLLKGLQIGSAIRITGAKPNTRGEGRGYSLDEKSTVSAHDARIAVPFTPLGSVADRGIYSVRGTVVLAKEPRPFTSRSGSPSWVRNIVIADGPDTLSVVLWGDHALLAAEKGSAIEIYHAAAKPGRYAGIELHAGKDTCVRIPCSRAEEIVFAGTVIADQGGSFLDNGEVRYLLAGGDLPVGREVVVTGAVSGSRILPARWEPVPITAEQLRQRIGDLRKILTCSAIGRPA